MFGITLKNFIRVLIWVGFINPPKGEGKWFECRLNSKLGESLEKDMRKVWQKAFKGTEYCANSSDSFAEFMEDESMHFSSMDGILYHEVKKAVSVKNSGIYLDMLNDVTERVVEREQKQFRLDDARVQEKSAIASGNVELMLEKKQLVQQLKMELDGGFHTISYDGILLRR